MNTSNNSNNMSKRKKKSPLLRILTLVVLLCVAVFGAIIISDLVAKNNTEDNKGAEPEFITIKISGDFIYLDGEQVTLEALANHLDTEYAKGDFPVVSLINDTENPSDYGVYNKVADLLSEYGIEIEKMLPSSDDEISKISTSDEV